MTLARNSTCPEPETLAAFAEGRLQGAAATAVVAHLDTCDACMRDVSLGMQAIEEEEALELEETNVVRPRQWMPRLAIAAASVLIVLLIATIANTLRRSPIDRLVAATPKSARVIEPRLSGGFAWAPYRGSDRASGQTSSDPANMKLVGTAGEIVEHAQQDTSAGAQHGAGVALVLTQNADEGIARLENAVASAPSAQTWSDLAAARYTAASDLGRAALYPQALAAADAALRFDGNSSEALFNRALILERMGLFDDARIAWNRYLASDGTSPWAVEARTRLAELPAAKKASEFERDRPLFERAAAERDEKQLRGLLTEHAARARAFGESEYLGRWGATALKNEGASERWLTIARAIGTELATQSNETLLRDAVHAIEAASPAQRQDLAAAHVAYRTGRIAYSRQHLDEATNALTRAADLFEHAHSPMALAAHFYLASIQQTKNEGSAAGALERSLAALNAHATYRALGASVRWDLGRARMFDYDWSGAASLLSESAATFRETGDRTNEAFVESMLAHCLAAEGRGDEAWISRIRAFRALSHEGSSARLVSAINGAMRAELLAGRSDVALALARLPRPIAGDAAQRSLLLDTLQYRSLLESANGRNADALHTAREAATLAASVVDPSLRARRLADVDVAIGAASAMSDPVAATASLTRAIDFYRRTDSTLALPEALLLRARTSQRNGIASSAAQDLEEGMSIIERHRARNAATAGTGIFNADQALFAESMRMSLDRGDHAAAFATAERSRGASLTVAELQTRLAGSDTAVLEIVALPEEVASFAIAEDAFRVARHRKTVEMLTPLVDTALSERDTTAAATLYDDLVRPVAATLFRARNVIVVPDPRLQHTPFAALFDATSGTYLIERAGIATASSASTLRRENTHATTSLIAIALPSGGTTGMAALPEAERELAEVAADYRHAMTVAPERATMAALRDALSGADIVHVAGHTERQRNGREHALLLASANGSALERVSARSIAASSLPHARVLILAACETLLPPASSDTRALSLGAAFATAGVADTIGTLAPIGDRDARGFFRLLHQQLAAGAGAIDALRATQSAAIQQQRSGSGSPVWRPVALLTNRIYAPSAHREAGS